MSWLNDKPVGRSRRIRIGRSTFEETPGPEFRAAFCSIGKVYQTGRPCLSGPDRTAGTTDADRSPARAPAQLSQSESSAKTDSSDIVSLCKGWWTESAAFTTERNAFGNGIRHAQIARFDNIARPEPGRHRLPLDRNPERLRARRRSRSSIHAVRRLANAAGEPVSNDRLAAAHQSIWNPPDLSYRGPVTPPGELDESPCHPGGLCRRGSMRSSGWLWSS